MELQPPRGTEDLLPPRSHAMVVLYERAHELGRRYGYRYVETPAFEATELFARSSGQTSDIVSKEMYTFEDRGGRSLTLRPESTAPVVRSYLSHQQDLGVPFKAYYIEANWRYGRPQAGRLREFRQFGVEVIGAPGAEADVEVIAVGEAFLRASGLTRFELQLNSIGDETCRPAYREGLIAYLEAHRERLRDEHRDRFRDNPMRVLDCKDDACRDVAEDAPKIVDHLCDPCRAHFDDVQSGLKAEGVEAVLTPTLVRGLDYYTRTAFEFVSEVLGPQQSTVCGGGRYDGLAEVLGGRPTPGVGFGLGLDRVLLAADGEGAELPRPELACFVVGLGAGAEKSSQLLRMLRGAGISADAPFEDRPLGAQMKMADRAGARFALIVGEREAADGTVTVRRLDDGHQETVPMTDVVAWISRQA
ncbi:MAG: histidine--tRNA ligase [Actinomycetota bacterium]